MQSLAALLPGIANVCPSQPAPTRPKVRAADRAAQWRRHLETAAGALVAQAATPSQSAAIEAAYTDEIRRGPDFAKCRKEARFIEVMPRGAVDRNAVARALWTAEQISRGFWRADRKAAKDSGQRIKRTVSRSALDVLRALGRLAVKHRGRVFPSLAGLAHLACVSRRTACRAIAELEGLGLIEIMRRAKRVSTPFGLRQVQDTSLYAIRPAPIGLGAMAVGIFGIGGRSECQPGTARTTSNGPFEKEVRVADASLRQVPDHAPSGTRMPWQSMIRGRR